MINSRRIDELDPRVAAMCREFMVLCDKAGIEVIITSTYRDMNSQAALYAQGRTAPGRIVTNAKPGQSYHNYRLAFDFVPVVGGKAVWDDDDMWEVCGDIAEQVGLEWAGRWRAFKEKPHCQWTGGLNIKDLQAGKRP